MVKSAKPKAPAATAKPKASAVGTAKASSGKSKTAPKSKPTERETASEIPASQLIDQRIRDLPGWRGETLARMRALILQADPEIVEEFKWMGTPVWSRNGILCTGESYKQVVKLTFANGATIADPDGLFNSSLEGNMRRAIDIREGETLDADAFTALVRSAVVRNGLKAKTKKR